MAFRTMIAQMILKNTIIRQCDQAKAAMTVGRRMTITIYPLVFLVSLVFLFTPLVYEVLKRIKAKPH